MRKLWYLSPSNQGGNIGVGNYGTEREQMYLLVEEITPHLDRAGVSFCVPDRSSPLTERVKESNDMGAGFHLALHSNAGGSGKARGPVGLYYSEEGKAFCQELVDAMLALGQENNRSNNLARRTDLYELRKTNAPAALLEVDFHDCAQGVDFLIHRRSEIGEAIARVIIRADGREFVPITPGEYIDKAVTMGLFPRETCWEKPMTLEAAAELAVKLANILGRG